MWAEYSRRVAAGVLTAESVQERAVAALARLLEAAGRGQARGVYLHGGVGRGKTMLMDLFHSALPAPARARGALRTHFHAFMQGMHASLHRDPGLRGAGDPVRAYAGRLAASAPLLLFDELEVADIGDAMLLKRLLSQYWAQGGTLVATSNAAPRELYHGGLNYAVFEPLVGELESRCEVVDLTRAHADTTGADVGAGVLSAASGDYRRVVGAAPSSVPVLFHGNGLEAAAPAAELDALAAWRAHTSGAAAPGAAAPAAAEGAATAAVSPASTAGEGEALDVRVAVSNTRSTVVPRLSRCGGAAWFTFAALCGADSALSPADYLALADRLDAFGVATVPRFTRDNENEARRFISLVDVLYERRALLVAALAAPPDALFAADGGAGDPSASPRARVGWEGALHNAGAAFAVVGEGGASGRATTMVGGMEWSATGSTRALADLQAASFVFRAAPRCVSRLIEMGGGSWGAAWRGRREARR
jgi:cell division protein ZapE